jgi:hypothetical protein
MRNVSIKNILMRMNVKVFVMRSIAILCLGVSMAAMVQAQSLEFVMDMVHNNPGEERYVTKYNNPSFLKAEGFNGMVTHWHVNCAITYDNFDPKVAEPKSDERLWIENKAKWIDAKIAECEKAGMDIYPFTDFIVFPDAIWEKYGDSIKRTSDGIGHSIGSKGEARIPDIQRKTTQELLRAQIQGVFSRFPQLDGVMLRFGETYLHDTPYHRGGSPIRKGNEGIQDHITFINILREEICVKQNKKLFYRTWDFGWFHVNPDYYLAVTNAIEPHPNLIFSIKYQEDDFLRMTAFNPTIGIGKHRQIVEAQSRMEAYGKGAHPYYSAYGVINGWPETKYEIKWGSYTGELADPEYPRGMKDVLDRGLLCGVYTWSHGGGWQGPYISNEIWTDLNTYVVSKWGQNPYCSEEELFYLFAEEKLGLSGFDADIFRQISLLSIEAVRKGHCNSYTFNDKWWARDEFFSVASNHKVISSILEKGVEEKVLAEKAEASAMWRQIVALSEQLSLSDSVTQEAIRVSCQYGRIKFELIEQMWILMIEDAKEAEEQNKEIIVNAISRYDALWADWKKLKKSSDQCATLYTDLAFRNKLEGSIRELVERLR